jgi:hypothetical protein
MLRASELHSRVTCAMDIYIAVVNHTVENIFVVLLIKLTYKVNSKIPKKIYQNFPGFPCYLQKTADVVP